MYNPPVNDEMLNLCVNNQMFSFKSAAPGFDDRQRVYCETVAASMKETLTAKIYSMERFDCMWQDRFNMVKNG